MDKITGNEPIAQFVYEDTDGYSLRHKGITIRQHFAAMETSTPTDKFYRLKLEEFNKRGGFRKTTGHPMEVMTIDEIIEVKASWKARMADALITELNKEI